MKLLFKKGQKYSRNDVGYILFLNKNRPKGGNWDTLYVNFKNNSMHFINIVIAGTTINDFVDLKKMKKLFDIKTADNSFRKFIFNFINCELFVDAY